MANRKKIYKSLTVQQKNALFTEMKAGVLTAKELSQKYGITERTIYRYRKDLKENPGEILATTGEVVQGITETMVDGFLAKSMRILEELTDRIAITEDLTDTQKIFVVRDTLKIINELKKTLGFQAPPPELQGPNLNFNFFVKYLEEIPKEHADLLRPVVMGLLGEPIDAQASV